MCGRCYNGLEQRQVERFAGAIFENNRNNYTMHYNVCPSHSLPVITYKSSNNLKKSEDKVTNTTPNQKDINKHVEDKKLSGTKNTVTELQTNTTFQINIEQSQDDFEIKPNRKLEASKWGWNTKYGPVINCRFEEAHTKGMFKNLIQTNRCVIIVQGYYEWTKDKWPYAIRNKNPGCPIFLGGILNSLNEVILCTRPANDMMSKVHHRMGISLDESEIDTWLNPKTDYHKEIIQRLTLDDNQKGFQC